MNVCIYIYTVYIIIWYVWAGAVLMSGHTCLWFQDILWRDSPWFAVIPQCAFPIFDSRASTFQSCSCTSTLLMCLTSWDGRVVELWNSVKHCETVFSAPGSHGCQWYAIYANGHSRASVSNKSKWSASVSAALVFTQIIDSKKKTMCIASLLPSEHISWYLWHFPSSTRPTWEYDSFNWHRWRPLILTRDLKSNDVAETWTLRQTRILRPRMSRMGQEVTSGSRSAPPRAQPPCRPSARAEATALRFASWCKANRSWRNRPEEQFRKTC